MIRAPRLCCIPSHHPYVVPSVGCYTVGCEQLIFGSCCQAAAIPRDETIVAPQIALIDAFAAASFDAIKLCSRCYASWTLAPRILP